MGFNDDDVDELIESYKLVMEQLIARGDSIMMITDDDEIEIIISRVHAEGVRIDRHPDKFFHDIITVGDNGFLVSAMEKYHYKRFKKLRRIPITATVIETVFIPWMSISDLRLRHRHQEDDLLITDDQVDHEIDPVEQGDDQRE